mgnify:CR=1 FL=1
MKRSILFVDDEPQILEGLRHRLHRQRARWEMAFVASGNDALQYLAEHPVDVLITDMRMPGMDGAQLLQIVQSRHPGVVRIVLSGHAELEASLRAIPVAHQFLNKPSEPGELENVVERACALQSLVNDDTVRSLVGQIGALPPAPRIYGRLMAALAADKCTAAEVAKLLSQDVAISAKTLQMVNSAFFRLSRKVTKVEEAVVYLGLNTIKQIVLAAEVFQGAQSPLSKLGNRLDVLQSHAVAVAQIASNMFKDKSTREDAFTAGLLHDVGKMLLLMSMADRCLKLEDLARERGLLLYQCEREEWGATHAEVGAYLLGLWGLPYPLIETVGNHHEPRRVTSQGFGVLAAVHLADGLVRELEPGRAGPQQALWDSEYVESMGVGAEVSRWRELAKEVVQRAKA